MVSGSLDCDYLLYLFKIIYHQAQYPQIRLQKCNIKCACVILFPETKLQISFNPSFLAGVLQLQYTFAVNRARYFVNVQLAKISS